MGAAVSESVITNFDTFEGDNPYSFLSNFHDEPVWLPAGASGSTPDTVYGYRTGEHMFAAAKARNWEDHMRVAGADTPGRAKMLGRRLRLRDDWELVKYDVMRCVLAYKFAPGTELAAKLLGTGDALLVEGTRWHDRVWGVDLNAAPHDHRSPGLNWLGTLLMARRAELRAQLQYGVDVPLPDVEILAGWVY